MMGKAPLGWLDVARYHQPTHFDVLVLLRLSDEIEKVVVAQTNHAGRWVALLPIELSDHATDSFTFLNPNMIVGWRPVPPVVDSFGVIKIRKLVFEAIMAELQRQRCSEDLDAPYVDLTDADGGAIIDGPVDLGAITDEVLKALGVQP